MERTHLILLACLFPAGSVWGQDGGTDTDSSPPEEAPAPAQGEHEPAPRTLLPDKAHHGGFGGPTLMFSRLLGRGAFFFGGRGGWIVAHRFVLGGGGYGVLNEVPVSAARVGAPGGSFALDFGYAGVWFEYILLPDRLVHASLGTHLGAGSVRYHRASASGGEDTVARDSVFVLDPTACAELNVNEFLRIGVGLGYRYVSGLELEGLHDSDLSGFTGSVIFKFGTF